MSELNIQDLNPARSVSFSAADREAGRSHALDCTALAQSILDCMETPEGRKAVAIAAMGAGVVRIQARVKNATDGTPEGNDKALKLGAGLTLTDLGMGTRETGGVAGAVKAELSPEEQDVIDRYNAKVAAERAARKARKPVTAKPKGGRVRKSA